MRNSSRVSVILDYFAEIAGKDVSFSDESHDGDQSFFAYSAFIDIFNKKYAGYGQSNNKDEAIYIALMELVERYVLDTYKNTKFFKLKKTGFVSNYELFRNYTICDDNTLLSNSNGLAVHTSSSKAIENSLNEIIERHVILKALCSDQVPCSTSANLKSFGNFFNDLECSSFYWKGPIGKYVAITRVSNEKRSVYGFGCSSSLRTSVEKSIGEVYPRVCLLKKYGKSSSIIAIPNKNFLFHWYERADWTRSFFSRAKKSRTESEVDTNLKISDFTFGELDLSSTILGEVGIKAFFSFSEKVQPHFSGDWSIEKINTSAIKLPVEFPPDMHMIG